MKNIKASNKNLRHLTVLLLGGMLCTSCTTIQPLYETVKSKIISTIEEIKIDKYKRDKDEKNWDITLLDTAKEISYLSLLERNVVLELNKVRSDPKKYAELYITPMISRFNGLEYGMGEARILTKEGSKAVAECISVLKRASPMTILSPDEGLYRLAARQVELQGPTGQTGHSSPTGLNLSARVRELSIAPGYLGENISYGYNNAREIIISLLVDDGVPSRGHRANIMNSRYKIVGISTGSHKEYRYMCVIDFSSGK